MLSELWQYLTTPCNRLYRKSGHLKELIAIHGRYQRVKPWWQPHLQHSQQFIESAMADCPTDKRAIILGSGLLLDIPVQQLSQHFTFVILIDVAHHRSVRKQVTHLDNITLLEHDITGLTQKLISCESLPTANFSIPVKTEPGDLLVSANLLSQLAIIPLQYVRKHTRFNETDLQQWAQSIISSHIKGLKNEQANVCLLTDVTASHYDRHNQLINSEDLLYGYTLPRADSSWIWQLAPFSEAGRHIRIEHCVQAYRNFAV